MRVLDIQSDKQVFEIAADIIGRLEILGGTMYSDKIVHHHHFSICAYEKDERVFSRTEFIRSIAIVIQGFATVKKEYSGCDLVIRTLGEGDFFGVAALFGNEETYVSEVIAESGCTVAFVPESIVESVFRACPDAAITYIKTLSQKIRYLNKKIDNFTAPCALAKLSIYLYENPKLKISMKALAERLGMTRMTLYRNLNTLVENRCVRKEGKNIEVLDLEALLQYASPGEII